MLKTVHIFTDGSCLGNPGPGGYGAILRYQGKEKELSQGYKLTTNNRMEMRAAIVALQALKQPCNVEITTDSSYVKDGITKWIKGWQKNNWKTSAKKPVKNVDLWQALVKEVDRHNVKWHWVRGHTGHAENERCDELARTAAEGTSLIDDLGYQPN